MEPRTHEPAVSRREVLCAGAVAACSALVAGLLGAAQPARAQTVGHVTTSDGVRLHYLEAGAGQPLVLIPGWSQTAAMYQPQLDGLGQYYRVIALDMRGHGESDKPAHGSRMARLALDTHEALVALNLRDVTLAGHSMGCSVIWSYWEHFGSDRLSKLILIDQAPTSIAWPGWTDEEKATAGARLDPTALYDTAIRLSGPEGVKTTEHLITTVFFTKAFPQEQRAWVLAENLKFPRRDAARLLVDHRAQDWRDVIPRITLPTLVVGGRASVFTPKSQEWIGQQIPGARVEIFDAHEGGSHFMWLENPAKFNQIVRAFMG
jgi:non-heme chloroperoxidase